MVALSFFFNSCTTGLVELEWQSLRAGGVETGLYFFHDHGTGMGKARSIDAFLTGVGFQTTKSDMSMSEGW